MFQKIIKIYLNIRYKLHCWWNVVKIIRIPLPEEETADMKVQLALSVGEVFHGYKIEDVSTPRVIIDHYPPIDLNWIGGSTLPITEDIEVTLNELYSRSMFHPDALSDIGADIKQIIMHSLRKAVEKKKWTRLFIRNGINTEIYKELYVHWKRWQIWLNWLFDKIFRRFDPGKLFDEVRSGWLPNSFLLIKFQKKFLLPEEKEKYMVEYRVRIGGYDEKEYEN